MAMEWPYLIAFSLVENPEGMMCQLRWKEAFGAESLYAIFLISEATMVFVYIPAVLLVALYSIIVIKLKKQSHPGEQSANAEEQRKKKQKNHFPVTS